MATTLTDTTTTTDLDAKRREIVAQAEASGLRLVRFLYCDNDGIIRGKSAGIANLAERLETGIGLTVAMQAFTLLDHLATVDGMGPVGEIRLVPDPTTFAIAPYAPHTGTVLVDMQTLAIAVVNEATLQMLGYAEQELAGRSILELVPPEDIAAVERAADEPPPEGETCCEKSR